MHPSVGSKITEMSAEEILRKFDNKLCSTLPLDDPNFLEILENCEILPEGSRDKIQAEKTKANKADYYFQHIMKTSTDLYLPKLLKAMEDYNNKYTTNTALQDLLIHMIAEMNSKLISLLI